MDGKKDDYAGRAYYVYMRLDVSMVSIRIALEWMVVRYEMR